MSRLGFALLAFLSPFVAFAADPPLPKGAVARLGHARIVVKQYPGQLFVTPDGKLITDGLKWFDVESGEAADGPYSPPESASLQRIRTDGRADYWDGEQKESLTLEPDRPVTPKGAAKAAADRFLIEDTFEGEDDARRGGLRIAPVPKPGAEPEWKEIANHRHGFHGPHFNDGGGKVVWRAAAVEDDDADVVTVYDFDTGKSLEIDVTRAKGERHITARLSPDDRTVAVQLSERVILYDAADGKEQHARPTPGVNHQSGGFTADGRGFYAPDRRGGAFVPLDPKAKPIPLQHRGGSFSAFALFPDSKRVAVADQDGVVRIYDLTTGQQTDKHTSHPLWAGVQVVGPHTAACWSQSGELLRWDLRTGEPITAATAAGGLRDANAEFNHDGRRFLASDYDRARLIDPANGKTLAEVKGAERARPAARFSADGRWAAVQTAEGNDEDGWRWRLELLAAESGERKRRIASPTPGVDFDPFIPAPDGRTVIATRGREVTLLETATGGGRWAVGCATDPLHLMTDAAGRRLVVLCGEQAVVLDAATGRQQCALHLARPKDYSRCWSLSPSGRWFVAHQRREGDRAEVSVFDLDGESPSQPVYRADAAWPEVTDLAVTDDGPRVVTAHPDGTCLVWDLAGWVKQVPPKAAAKADARTPWELLADADPAVAQRAFAALLADPDAAVKLFEKHLPPAAVLPDAELTKRIAELGSPDFATREAATKALAAVADQAEEKLRAALKSSTAAEQRERLEQLVGRAGHLVADRDRLRQVRAVEILERVGTPAAAGLLKKYAAGAAGAVLTREAMDSLTRLKR